MDLTLTDEQEMIRATARKLLRDQAATAGVRAVRDGPGDGYCHRLWQQMADLGWTGLAVPERHGGLGSGFLESCLLAEELGAALVPSPFLVTTACAGTAIELFGTDEQRAVWLPAIVAGRPVTAATTSRIAAVRSADGFTLTGTATFVPFAEAAEAVIVAAHADTGPSVFLLDTAHTDAVDITALRAVGPVPLYRLRLEDVAVPADAVLGRIDRGHEVIDALERRGAAATCAEMVGGAQRVLDLTLAYATERRQFGRPIGSFQAVQHHCADMAVDVLSARLIAYEAIWRLADARDGGPGGSHPEPSDVALPVSCAKAWVSEAYQRVCALGHQVHGAIGFTAEHDLHLYLQHSMSAALAFGDTETHTRRVADRLGLPRHGGHPHHTYGQEFHQ
ncbi:acyl-CoA dehydrogenase family protein [Streptomyces sp. NPDC059788]|uniref:acyl-CoA dehydrogenase family protein n=1 Tax=Streptomyces sp. NPDC059788 TaxID=3346948 RepID=UPI00364D06A7